MWENHTKDFDIITGGLLATRLGRKTILKDFDMITGGFLATRFGGKTIFLIGIAATSTLTLVTPFLAKSGTGFLITTRILEGLFEVSFGFITGGIT